MVGVDCSIRTERGPPFHRSRQHKRPLPAGARRRPCSRTRCLRLRQPGYLCRSGGIVPPGSA